MAPSVEPEKKRTKDKDKDKDKELTKRRSKRSKEEQAPSAMDEELEFLAQWIPVIFCLAFLTVCVGALYMSANGGWVTKQGRHAANERMSEEDTGYGEL